MPPTSRSTARPAADATKGLAVHLLDVGHEDYGDSLLVEAAGRRILIDGGHRSDRKGSPEHPSIPDQLRGLLNETKPRIDLLVVSHAHLDHIGCLPELVSDKVIEVHHALLADPGLGWGDGAGVDAIGSDDARVRTALSGLREEVPSRSMSDSAVESFLADSITLRERYDGMITKLTAQGAKVTLLGPQTATAIQREFDAIDLQVLGPSRVQLEACSAGLAEALDDAAEFADRLLSTDAASDATDLYQALIDDRLDDAGVDAASSRPGGLVNLQSIVMTIGAAGRRLFFGGDSQLASPGTRDAKIRREVELLRRRIRRRSPYSFVKVGHHGSSNSLDADTLEDFGNTRLFGMCLGSGSLSHPDRDVLQLLASRPDAVWARTDRNGLTSMRRTARGWEVSTAKRDTNDMTQNTDDEAITPPSAPAALMPRTAAASAAPRPSATPLTSTTRANASDVEVIVHIPVGVERVRVDIEVGRSAAGLAATATAPALPPPTDEQPLADGGELRIANGRVLPPLLYVTDVPRLRSNIGSAEADTCVAALERQPGVLLDLAGAPDVAACEQDVQKVLAMRPEIAGIVLVGGYDVVPSHAIDTVPEDLEPFVRRRKDADRFVIWTDDLYGHSPDPVKSRPVSRVPDAHQAGFLFRALGADLVQARDAAGIRNVRRPFAEPLYDTLPGRRPMLVSEPSDTVRAGSISAGRVYLMLHGNFRDTALMWGEFEDGDNLEAFSVSAVGASPGSVVLTGACWGALTVDTPAVAFDGAPMEPRGPANAISLAFLNAGANAYVGCTGSHYSPREEPFDTMGAPIHRAFWKSILAGAGASKALHDAKIDYRRNLPHGLVEPIEQAFEHKILWEFTCLGLGW